MLPGSRQGRLHLYDDSEQYVAVGIQAEDLLADCRYHLGDCQVCC